MKKKKHFKGKVYWGKFQNIFVKIIKVIGENVTKYFEDEIFGKMSSCIERVMASFICGL